MIRMSGVKCLIHMVTLSDDSDVRREVAMVTHGYTE